MKNGLRHLLSYARNPGDAPKTAMMWLRARPRRENPVFVVGPPRSGTTLVQRMLACHPDFATLPNETQLVCPKNPFDVSRFDGWVCDADTYRRALARSRDMPSLLVALHEEVLGPPPEGGAYLEKTPQHARALKTILGWFPNGRAIFVCRDPRDCLSSARSSEVVPQSSAASRYARYWRSCLEGRARAGFEHSAVHDVRYEDLAARPEETLQGVMDFLGRERLESQLDPARIGADSRAGSASFARLSSPVDASTVGRWRHDLDEQEVRTVERVCASGMRRYGYME